jgi:membrane protein implicated in regulation of membrane protease activity
MIEGVDWRAVTADNEVLAKGTKVVVVAINSVVLTVKKL